MFHEIYVSLSHFIKHIVCFTALSQSCIFVSESATIIAEINQRFLISTWINLALLDSTSHRKHFSSFQTLQPSGERQHTLHNSSKKVLKTTLCRDFFHICDLRDTDISCTGSIWTDQSLKDHTLITLCFVSKAKLTVHCSVSVLVKLLNYKKYPKTFLHFEHLAPKLYLRCDSIEVLNHMK